MGGKNGLRSGPPERWPTLWLAHGGRLLFAPSLDQLAFVVEEPADRIVISAAAAAAPAPVPPPLPPLGSSDSTATPSIAPLIEVDESHAQQGHSLATNLHSCANPFEILPAVAGSNPAVRMLKPDKPSLAWLHP